MKTKQYLVIGAGRFGSALARALYQQGHEVVVIDQDEEKIEKIMDDVTHALIADASDEDVLRRVGCRNFDAVVVAIGADFEASIMTTVAAKSLGARRVIAKAVSDSAAAVLERVGADEVVRPEHDMGVRVARQLTTPDLVDAFKLGEGHAVIEVEVKHKLMGRLGDQGLPKRFSVQVIAVNRNDQVVVSPGADFVLERGDTLVLLGSNEAIQRFQEHISD